MREKSLVVIYILEILKQYSSPCHRLKQEDIIYFLEQNYNIKVSRNTLSSYLTELRELGRIGGKRGVYYVHKFTNEEIRMIADSVMYSKAIPKEDIHNIVTKLKDMTEPEHRKNWSEAYYIDSVHHTDNKNIGSIVCDINLAIQKRRKIEILTCHYNINGTLEEHNKRVVSPYYIVSEKSRYYLLCYAGREDVEPRRIDRICKIKILKERRIEINEIAKYSNHTFQVGEYMKEHIYMYTGNIERITLKVKKENIGDVIDWYGKDYQIINQQDETEVIIRIKANVNAVYFWALQYASIVEVLEPVSLRKMLRDGAENIWKKYNS